ncbi:MAG: hypothetical protein ACF8TS_00390, partial [Maioricimonas sp. JB049]
MTPHLPDSRSDDEFDDRERRLFEMLDAYVERADHDDSQALPADQFPELPGLLDCLGSLESLAELTAPQPPAADGETVLFDNASGPLL